MIRTKFGIDAKSAERIFIQDADNIPYEELQPRVEQRVESLQILPAIPEIVLRIMHLANDPNCNVEALGSTCT